MAMLHSAGRLYIFLGIRGTQSSEQEKKDILTL
jgi:hypothetical protein